MGAAATANATASYTHSSEEEEISFNFHGGSSSREAGHPPMEEPDRDASAWGILFRVTQARYSDQGPDPVLWTPTVVAGLIYERLAGEAPMLKVIPYSPNQVALVVPGSSPNEGMVFAAAQQLADTISQFVTWGGYPAHLDAKPIPLREIRLRQMELKLKGQKDQRRAKARRNGPAPPSQARAARKAASDAAHLAKKACKKKSSTKNHTSSAARINPSPSDHSDPEDGGSDELPSDHGDDSEYEERDDSADGYQTAVSTTSDTSRGSSRRSRRRRGADRTPNPRGRPKLPGFSDEKGSLSYSAWKQDVNAKLKLGFKEVDVLEAMQISLTEKPSEVYHMYTKNADNLTVRGLLEEMDQYYGPKMSFDEMDSSCLTIKQEFGEKVGSFGVRLSQHVDLMQTHYPELLSDTAKETKLAHRFYGGLKTSLRNQLTCMKILKDQFSYKKLLYEALRLEQAETSWDQKDRSQKPPPRATSSFPRYGTRKPDYRRPDQAQARAGLQNQEEETWESADPLPEEQDPSSDPELLDIQSGDWYENEDQVCVKLQHALAKARFPPGCCYNCGTQGHMAAECTQPPRKPSFKDEWYAKNGGTGPSQYSSTPFKRATGSRPVPDRTGAQRSNPPKPTTAQKVAITAEPPPAASQ